MSRVFTPSNQIKLTNVSVVRLKRGGHQFELACYTNKIQDYRASALDTNDDGETLNKEDKAKCKKAPKKLKGNLNKQNQFKTTLDEVLQTTQIFTNVSKGQLAPSQHIQAAFPSSTYPTPKSIIHHILIHGQIQMGSEERSHELSNIQRSVSTLVATMLINPETKRPYPLSVIEVAMKAIHFSPSLTKNIKVQAVEVCKALVEGNVGIDVIRVPISVRISLNCHEQDIDEDNSIIVDDQNIRDFLQKNNLSQLEIEGSCRISKIQRISSSGNVSIEASVAPESFKALKNLVEVEFEGRIEIINKLT